MAQFDIVSEVSYPFDWVRTHFDQRLFEALAPAFPQMRLDRYDGQQPGDLISLRLGFPPLWVRWTSQITEVIDTPLRYEFVDMGTELPAPLRTWKHIHTLTPDGANRTLIHDQITLEATPGLVTPLVAKLMKQQFRSRQQGYQRYYDRLAANRS